MNFRRTLTTALIRIGPRNPLVIAAINHKCREHGATLTRRGDYLTLQKGQHEVRLALNHFVYAPDVASNFDMYFSPLVPTIVDGVSILDFSRVGLLHTYAATGVQFEMASLPEEADAIESYLHWYTPQPGDTVFDIGAHCGVSTYRFAKLVGASGHVVAFEPDPTNFAILKRNIARHKLDNVTPVRIAIAGEKGLAKFNSEAAIGSGLKCHTSRVSSGKVIEVETITLEQAFDRWGVSQFCKIDIEGAEIEVITAAQAFINKHSCHFALDTNHLVGDSLTDGRIEALFRGCGYETASSGGVKTTWARPLGSSHVPTR